MSNNNKTIAFQGFAGAYSDLACRAVYPEYETVPCNSFEEAFKAVGNGLTDLAMIPVDNTLAGRVADVHHLIPKEELHIIGEHFQPIRHALLGVKGAKKDNLKHVHSHIHAIPQCKKIIKELGLEPHVHADTAGAASEIAEKGDETHAAIASTLAADIYGLDVLIDDIQDADHNTTRFLIFSREQVVPKLGEKTPCITSMVYKVRNIPAALYKTLGGFATNGISMTKLESYVGENFNVAQFYAEVEGHPDDPAFVLAIEELSFYASELSILGTYPAHEFRNDSTKL